jgi:large subunit ribosomal protein L1
MIKTGKRIEKAQVALSAAKIDSLKKGLDFVVKNATAKFDESVNLSIVLGIDASKGEQTVRGSALLPHGTGKSVRVLVFATGEKEQEAKAAGADFVGLDDLIEKIEGGWIGFDVAVATTDLMGKIGRLAKVLGPKGLLPNKKVGTVTDDLKAIISDLKKGRVSFRNDKSGAVHAAFGKVSFGADKLEENLVALIKSIRASKPASSKGKFIRKIVVSSTMGVGIALNPDEVV